MITIGRCLLLLLLINVTTLTLTPCILAVIFATDGHYVSADCIEYLSGIGSRYRGLHATEAGGGGRGRPFLRYCQYRVVLTFYIHVFGTCIWCYLTEFAIRFSLNYWYFNFLCNEKYRYMYQKLVIEK